ncbi:MAG: hypothetical protein ACPLRH_03215 [Desulfotomaculales bacterium]
MIVLRSFAGRTVRVLRGVLKNERGTLPEMTWQVGAGIVVALVIVAAMLFAPETAKSFWNAATNWIRNQFGF